MKNRLAVFWGSSPVGELALTENRRIEFTYGRAWHAAADAKPISCALPIRRETYPDELARPYFANLLPEARVRQALTQSLGLSPENDFGLLEAIGGECAGALSLWPMEGVRGAPPTQGTYEALSDSALESMILASPRHPLIAGPTEKSGFRLSLAGAQSKIPVYREENRVYLPRGNYSSTHIVKPPIPSLKNTVWNEAFSMRLAGELRLGVPEISLLLRGKSRSFCIARYDRRPRSDRRGDIERLHQEDFCQALSVLPEGKYEAEGGPGLRQCFALIADKSTEPATDRFRLLRWVIFNQLLGNADAHAKNLSFLFDGGQIRLAPFYDLLATREYPQLSDHAAMRIGGEKKIDAVTRENWEIFAREAEIKPKLVFESIAEVGTLIRVHGVKVSDALEDEFGESAALVELRRSVVKRTEKMLRRFKV